MTSLGSGRGAASGEGATPLVPLVAIVDVDMFSCKENGRGQVVNIHAGSALRINVARRTLKPSRRKLKNPCKS